MVTPTLISCYQRGATPDATAVLPALFFLFLKRWAEGTLPYSYEDGVMRPEAVREVFASEDPLATWVADETLFAELANKPEFLSLLRRKVSSLEQWVKQPQAQLTII